LAALMFVADGREHPTECSAMTTFCGGTTMDGMHKNLRIFDWPLLHMGVRWLVVNSGCLGLLLGIVALCGSLNAASAQGSAPKGSEASAMTKPIKIAAFGDSLTAGYLLAPSEAFPVVLGKVLAARGHNVEMINAGVSGDTTSAARDRLSWSVPPDAEAVILELGANDALRGLDPAETRRNLDAMIQSFQQQKADILLAGMLAPRSLGDTYTKTFDAIFPDLATKYGLLLYPFFLDKTALKPQLSLSDGLHPNAKGIEAIVNDILPKVEALIARVQARRQAAAKG
jgi:acyl-CoA thioesterase I